MKNISTATFKLNMVIFRVMAAFIIALFFVPWVSARTATYTYDERDRLIQEVYEDGTTINYTYDDTGNRLSKEVISANAGITLISPNGGERWLTGTKETLYWTYNDGVGPFVKIELLKGGVVSEVISPKSPIGTGGRGSYDWQVPADQPEGTDYRIRVRSTSNSAHKDTSRNSLTLAAPGSITLTSPTGVDSLERGRTYPITWTYAEDSGSSVQIELLKGGVLQSTIVFSMPIGGGGTGSYDWTIPSTQRPGTGYQIRVAHPSGAPAATSNPFIIVGGISVTTPKGGETWYAGTSRTIGWRYANGAGSSVNIELLKGGAAQSVIGSNIPIGASGKGSYSWAIPVAIAGASDYNIRVTSTKNSLYTDASDNDFTILPSNINLVSPNGSENWQAGINTTVRWTYKGDPGSSVKVELLKAGAVEQILAESAPIGSAGKGSCTWAVPADHAFGDDYKVRVTSTSNGAYTDTSDDNFTILPSSISVTIPNGGQSWQAGEAKTISWTYKGNPGASVKVDLLKGGALDHTLVASTSIGATGKGSCDWTIPPSQPPGSDYRIRVTSTSTSSYSDESDQDFTVVPISITVTTPDGGENWQAGTDATVRWTYKGDPGNSVKVELLKGGLVEQVLAQSTPIGSAGRGFCTWAVPVDHAYGDDYKIRITSTANSAYTDTSDDNFTILPSSISVTIPNGGQSWQAGAIKTIAWTYKGDPGGSVTIDLLKGGILDHVLISNTTIGTAGRGSYSWAIPSNQQPGTDYRVRVTSTTDSAFTDSGDRDFTILPASGT